MNNLWRDNGEKQAVRIGRKSSALHVARRNLFCVLALGMLGPAVWSCASQQSQSVAGRAFEQNLRQAKVDSLKNAKSPRRGTVPGKGPRRFLEYPYLTVRYKQNDAEVEMVLDPLSTNLSLQMQRSPNSHWRIMQGDSVIDQTRGRGMPDTLPEKIRPGKSPEKDITDEIVRDINLAQELFYQRKYKEALGVLNRSLARKPTAAAYALGGSIYFVNGAIKQAVKAWERALQINPDLPQVKQLVERYKKGSN